MHNHSHRLVLTLPVFFPAARSNMLAKALTSWWCGCLIAIALQSEKFGGGNLAVKQKVRVWPLSIALKQEFIWALRQGSHALCMAMKGAGGRFWKTLVLSTAAGRGTAGSDWDTTSKWPNWSAGPSVLPVLLPFSVIKVLFPSEKAVFPVVIPRQCLALGISKDFSYVQYHCLLLGCFSSPSTKLWGKCGLPVSAEVMPQGHTS